MKRVNRFLTSIFATIFFQTFFEKLHYISLKGMNYGSANSPLYSGELSVLKILQKDLPNNAVIFDVGANYGQYLNLLIKYLKDKNITIHCFEPDEYAFKKLNEKFGRLDYVVLNKFALGSENNNATLYGKKKGGVDSSLINTDKDNLEQFSIEVKTLDSYCLDNNISTIHFLKIDTEGFELNVLKGAENAFASNKIKRIQLEHGSIHSIIARSSIYEYKKILKNFTIYHIKQNGIRKLNYKPINEIYYNSNYYFEKD